VRESKKDPLCLDDIVINEVIEGFFHGFAKRHDQGIGNTANIGGEQGSMRPGAPDGASASLPHSR
jgi:hypothetical protein